MFLRVAKMLSILSLAATCVDIAFLMCRCVFTYVCDQGSTSCFRQKYHLRSFELIQMLLEVGRAQKVH